MDEGAAVLYQMERKLRSSLHNFAMETNVSAEEDDLDIDLDAVCILGCNDSTLDYITLTLQELVKHHQLLRDDKNRRVQPPVKVKEEAITNASDFGDAQFVLLCIDTSKEGFYRQGQIDNLCQAYKRARIIKARTCCAVVCDSGRQYPSMDALCSRYPELKLLAQRNRMVAIQRLPNNQFSINQTAQNIFTEWLELTASSPKANTKEIQKETRPEDMLPYSDIAQVLTREALRSMPPVGIIIRLIVMCILGLGAVLATMVFLCSTLADTNTEFEVRSARRSLSAAIEQRRIGKSEWSLRHDALVITGLQLNNPGWLFDSIHNQRSVDRMEIGILASIARSHTIQPGSGSLTPVRLAHYINALLACYQNPLDFYHHDLVSSLELYLLNKAPFTKALSVHDHSSIVLALANAGVSLHYQHVEGIIDKQHETGAFTLGVDEAALATMALSTVHGDSTVSHALNTSLTYLLAQRQHDGSYGNVFTTALVLQVINVTHTPLPPSSYSESLMWLKSRIDTDQVTKNLDIASHVLIALAGKSVLHVATFTGKRNADGSLMYEDSLTSTSLTTSQHANILDSQDITCENLPSKQEAAPRGAPPKGERTRQYGCHMAMDGQCKDIHVQRDDSVNIVTRERKREAQGGKRVKRKRGEFVDHHSLAINTWQNIILKQCPVLYANGNS